MRKNVIYINAEPIEEFDDERAYYKPNGQLVRRIPTWKAVCLFCGISILLWYGLIRMIF